MARKSNIFKIETHACAFCFCLGVSRSFSSNTLPKWIAREGPGKRRTGTFGKGSRLYSSSVKQCLVSVNRYQFSGNWKRTSNTRTFPRRGRLTIETPLQRERLSVVLTFWRGFCNKRISSFNHDDDSSRSQVKVLGFLSQSAGCLRSFYIGFFTSNHLLAVLAKICS